MNNKKQKNAGSLLKTYLNADDIMQALDISKTKAYKIIKSCNDELKERGYITIAGKVSTEYFAEKWYGFAGKTNKDN
jgi:hypothetical protein